MVDQLADVGQSVPRRGTLEVVRIDALSVRALTGPAHRREPPCSPSACNPAEALLEEDCDHEHRHGPGDVGGDAERVVDHRAAQRRRDAAHGDGDDDHDDEGHREQQHRPPERAAHDRDQVATEYTVVEASAAREAAQPHPVVVEERRLAQRQKLGGEEEKAPRQRHEHGQQTERESPQDEGAHRLHFVASSPDRQIHPAERD